MFSLSPFGILHWSLPFSINLMRRLQYLYPIGLTNYDSYRIFVKSDIAILVKLFNAWIVFKDFKNFFPLFLPVLPLSCSSPSLSFPFNR